MRTCFRINAFDWKVKNCKPRLCARQIHRRNILSCGIALHWHCCSSPVFCTWEKPRLHLFHLLAIRMEVGKRPENLFKNPNDLKDIFLSNKLWQWYHFFLSPSNIWLLCLPRKVIWQKKIKRIYQNNISPNLFYDFIPIWWHSNVVNWFPWQNMPDAK